MKLHLLLLSGLAACAALGAATENAAPADELARQKAARAAEVPTAPEGYRRPKDWKPVLYGKTLPEIARDHSAETMARAAARMKRVNAVIARGPYKATGRSIDAHPCPEWFIDAKLGIFVDWGPWSIASWSPYVKGKRLYPDWYEYRCRTDEQTIRYHERNWGKDFKSDHLLDLFRGVKFDAPALMKTFRACGAKYVVPFLKHHGGFCLWDCSYTFRDTVDMAARRDFAKEMAEACRAEGLKFGFYTSQAGEWEYPILQADGSLKMLVNSKLVPYTPEMEWISSGKVAVKDFVHDYIVPQSTEFIDKYDPDILWNDYDWMTYATENGSYEVAAYMYNRAEGRKEVAFNDRHGRAQPEEIAGRFTKRPRNWLRTVRGDFFTDEWGDTEECLDPAKWHPWESCSGISKSYGNHWMENFDAGMVMTEKEFICHFSDIVARGGNLLLLVNLDPQGAFPEVQRARLEQIGAWLMVYGEAIYSTRICAPFSTAAVNYTQSKDGRTVYAVVKEPAAEVALACELPDAAAVTVVGSAARLATRREGRALVVSIPPELAKGALPFALRCAK
ncbi:MAG: alpha-L-fucosidase [Kiritimatiellia bacterium]